MYTFVYINILCNLALGELMQFIKETLLLELERLRTALKDIVLLDAKRRAEIQDRIEVILKYLKDNP